MTAFTEITYAGNVGSTHSQSYSSGPSDKSSSGSDGIFAAAESQSSGPSSYSSIGSSGSTSSGRDALLGGSEAVWTPGPPPEPSTTVDCDPPYVTKQ
jgi:hypothetical protein